MKNRIYQNIILVLISTILILIFLEGVLRLFSCNISFGLCDQTMNFVENDDEIHHKLISNSKGRHVKSEFFTTYEINSLGMRDKPYYNFSGYNILMLGDSFTEGFGVEDSDTISTNLEKLFEQDKIKVEVWNAGVRHYSPLIHSIYVEKNIGILNPDMIILNLDISDLQDDFVFESCGKKVSGKFTFEQCDNPDLIRKIHRFLRKNVYLYKLIDAEYITPYIGNQLSTLTKDKLGKIEFDPIFTTRFNLTDIETQPHYNRTFSYVKKIKEVADEKNIPFILVTYPYGHQVKKDYWKDGRVRYLADDYDVYSLEFFEKVDKFASENSIIYIDTYDLFKEWNGEKPFFDFDIHMTKVGYMLIANGIYNGLKDSEEFDVIKNKSQNADIVTMAKQFSS